MTPPGDQVQALTIRLPKDMYETLRKTAFDQRTTMNALIIQAVQQQQEMNALIVKEIRKRQDVPSQGPSRQV